jgi:hypothetical protein
MADRLQKMLEEHAASVFRVEEISLRTMLLTIPEYKCGPE